jgi:hypothetical protein
MKDMVERGLGGGAMLRLPSHDLIPKIGWQRYARRDQTANRPATQIRGGHSSEMCITRPQGGIRLCAEPPRASTRFEL